MSIQDDALIKQITNAFPVSSGIAEWAEGYRGGFILRTTSAPVVAYLLVLLYRAKKCAGGAERDCRCVPFDGVGDPCPVHDEAKKGQG